MTRTTPLATEFNIRTFQGKACDITVNLNGNDIAMVFSSYFDSTPVSMQLRPDRGSATRNNIHKYDTTAKSRTH